MFRALRHRNYRLFFSGQIISLVGTWMQSVAQSWLVYRLTGSSLLLGLVGFASQIPVFLLGSIGGAVADRYSRHRIVIATQTSAMVLAFILSALTLLGHIRVWQVMTLAAIHFADVDALVRGLLEIAVPVGALGSTLASRREELHGSMRRNSFLFLHEAQRRILTARR